MLRAILILMFFCAPVLAHDNPDNWIGQERRKNETGALCCGQGDCTSYPASAVQISPGGIRFPDGDVIPFNVPAPSADKNYWKCVWGGSVKCVFAPLGAS